MLNVLRYATCWQTNFVRNIKFLSNFLFLSSSTNFFFCLPGDGGDTNTINLDKYFYFPENNSDFSANNFKIALPNPPPPIPTQQTIQSTWVDYASVQSGNGNNGVAEEAPIIDLPPLTEIKQEKVDEEYEVVRDIPVWRTAKSTSKITMYPSKDTTKTQSKRKLQQIQPKPPTLTQMPPLTQIVSQKPAPKLIAVAVKKIIPIQPKPTAELPRLTKIEPKQSAHHGSPPQTKLVIKKVSHISMNTRRHSTGNSSKIVPTRELLESLKQENIIYQDNDEKPWYCKTCGRNYKWRNSLKQHIKNECGTDQILCLALPFNPILITKLSLFYRCSSEISLRPEVRLQNPHSFQPQATLEFKILQTGWPQNRRRLNAFPNLT